MKKLLASAMLAFFIATPQAYAGTCLPGNDSQSFMSYVATLPVKIFELNSRGRGAYITHANKLRAEAKLFPLQVDRVIFGVFKDSKKIGVVMFYDGCVVPGTVATIIDDVFFTFLEAAGVDPDDIIKQVSADS